MNKRATSSTLALLTAVLTAVGMTAQAGLCDESVSQSKQSEVTANPDGSTTEATAEHTEINRSNPAPLPVAKTKVATKVSSKVSTKTSAYKPKVGTTTQTSVHVKVR
ncbi:MAG: hypothetical protein IPP57_00140 [Candidatus Obscuribacter sp.]|jgi:hypothetical protein|nr:hypothetical protein [Candidatus Obscuribacter sp.]MBK9769237.1 hypothetical protein [Candidatus Obscuribacter sp.]MBL0184826.1 hypothetical protein [Candidatus Obscuribacter sp.]MDQ5964110.1 hypothetical protein [Cyanobacteriota bacterium erpe_2018_sw_39hr_WHONDRS-SW48-000098_B_bin.30]